MMKITVRVSPEEEFEVSEEELKDLLPSLPMSAQVQDPVTGTWLTGSAFFQAKDERELMAQAAAAQVSTSGMGSSTAVKAAIAFVVVAAGVGAFLAWNFLQASKKRGAYLEFARPYEDARANMLGFWDCVFTDGGFKKIPNGKIIPDWLSKKHKGKADAVRKEEELLSADITRCLPKLKAYVEAVKGVTDLPEEDSEAGGESLASAIEKVNTHGESLLKGWTAYAEDVKTLTTRKELNETVKSVALKWAEWGEYGKKGAVEARRYVTWLACVYKDDADLVTLTDSEPIVDLIDDSCTKDLAGAEHWADDVRTRCAADLTRPTGDSKPPAHIAHALKVFAGENITALSFTGCFEKVDKNRTVTLERDLGDAFDQWLYYDTTIVNKSRTALGGAPPWDD